MSDGEDKTKLWVTNAELKAELDKLPTRWEVRALVLGALIASQIVPPVEMARAALGLVL